MLIDILMKLQTSYLYALIAWNVQGMAHYGQQEDIYVGDEEILSTGASNICGLRRLVCHQYK